MKKVIFFLLIVVLSLALRLYNLSTNPPSLYWDEASLGYNAYSILTSGKDEHGEFFPLARFIAFGDFKPPGYIYAAASSIALFGLNEFAIRFPSFLSGTLLVLGAYLLTSKLLGNTKIALIAAFIMSISPWGIHFSRAAFEANMAATLNLFAIYFFICQKKRSWYLVLSLIFFILAFYTFNANRIISPLLIIILSFLFWRDTFKNWRWAIAGIIISVFLLLPSAKYLLDRESRIRFQEVSIFNNLETVKTSNERIEREGGNVIARVLYNRRVLFSLDFLKHLTDNFNLRFLFTQADANPRLSIEGLGLLYFYELPFLIIGIIYLLKTNRKAALLIFTWMIIAAVPAGTARETPHALRTISILPTYQILIASGVLALYYWVKNLSGKKILPISITTLTIVIAFHLYYFLHMYLIHYPVNWPAQWQYGYKEMVRFVLQNRQNYDKIYVTEALGRPYIYFALFTPYSQDDFQFRRDASRDWFGFWTVHSLDNIYFSIPQSQELKGKVLLVEGRDAILPPDFIIIKEIKEPNGNVVFKIAQKI